MRVNLKYFILLLFLYACRENREFGDTENSSLHSAPLTVALNTSEGYIVNKITGDSIKPLLNSFGDTITTGVLIPFKGVVVDPAEIAKPKIVRTVVETKIIIPGNVHPVPDKIVSIAVDTANFKSIKLGEGNSLHLLRNSNGLVTTGISIPVTGTKISLREPQPVKASPFRYKDGATANIQYMDVGQGLSYSYVKAIHEDKNGILWFGLDANGLCKYDGESITNYTQREGLANNNIVSIVEDDHGNLWIGSDDGISVFDGKIFTRYSKKDGLPNSRVLSIIKGKNNNIWFKTEYTGLTRYDGKSFINYTVKEGLPNDTVTAFAEDKYGNIWIGTRSGITKFDGNRFTHINLPFKAFNNSISTMLGDKKGNLWIGSWLNGIIKYDGKTFTHFTEKEGLPNNSITALIEDKKGNIWIGTRYNGVAKFERNSFTIYSTEQGLSDNKISSMIEDSHGNIWIGTLGGGVNKLNDEGFSQRVSHEYLGNSRVRPIMKDAHGNVWFGTEAGGIYEYDGKTITQYSIADALLVHGIRSILADKKGNLWFGKTDGGGLYQYDHKQFLHYTLAKDFATDNIMSILEDRNGDIWLGTYGKGAIRLNGNKSIYFSEKEGFPSNNIFTILEDKKGNLWFGTKGGAVVKYDGINFITFSEKEGLFCRTVTSIEEDEKGNIWLGTLGAGLCRFDGKNFTYYSEQEGLSYNYVWSIKEDSVGRFWVGTDKGLSLLVPGKDSLQKINGSYAVYSFGLQDGLKATDFNLHSVCIDNNNRIWWGTGKALITRDLNTEFRTAVPRSLSLNFIEINERFYDFRNTADSAKKKIAYSNVVPFYNFPENLSLSYDQNHLTFHFSAIDWSAPEKIRYSYRLSGLDNKWSNPSDHPMADYRNLRHGKYEFQVKAIGQSQEWTKPFNYSFIIHPAWWQTWLFKAAMIILVALILFFISRLIYLSRLRKQKNILEKQLAVQYERQRISTEMHDDVGAGLSGVRLLTEMAKLKTNDPHSISEIEKIYQSVGDVSARMKEVIWSLDTGNDHLSNLIFYLQKQARQMMENYPARFTCIIPENIPEVKISGEKRRHIYLAAKEALHNIIKHSGADKVEMEIGSNDILVITLKDNGRGFDYTKNDSAGNGLKNMKLRIEKLNGNFAVQNHNGTLLTFTIPLKQIK